MKIPWLVLMCAPDSAHSLSRSTGEGSNSSETIGRRSEGSLLRDVLGVYVLHLPHVERDELCLLALCAERNAGAVRPLWVDTERQTLASVDEDFYNTLVYENTQFQILILRKQDVCCFRCA